MPTTTASLATVEDYEALPEGAPYQLIRGQLVMSPAPTRFHQIAAGELAFAMRTFVRARDVPGTIYNAPLDVYFTDEDVYQPDVVFVSEDRSVIEVDEGLRGAPDLVVEVLSPSTGYYDLTEKKDIYASHGVREYWIVDPKRRHVDVLVNRDGEFVPHGQARESGRVRSHVLDGFHVDLDALFPWE